MRFRPCRPGQQSALPRPHSRTAPRRQTAPPPPAPRSAELENPYAPCFGRARSWEELLRGKQD